MKTITASLSFVFAAAFGSTALALVCQSAPARVADPPAVAVLGASASHGFSLADFLGDAAGARQRIAALLGRTPDDAEFAARTTSIGLGALIGELRAAPDSVAVDVADQMLFLSPAQAAKQQLRRALDSDAGLVLGVDLMFWFGYGGLSATERDDPTAARLARQRQAFDLLDATLADERWGAKKLVLGDYPDCSDASELMITKAMRPDAATLARLNEALAQWARRHANVRVFPLGALLVDMKTGRIAGADGAAIDEGQAMQFDRLHPTRFGMTILLRGLDAFVAAELPDLGRLVPPGRLTARFAAKQ